MFADLADVLYQRVIEKSSDLVEVVAGLKQIVCVKG